MLQWDSALEMAMPSEETAYWCSLHKGPILDKKHHIVAVWIILSVVHQLIRVHNEDNKGINYSLVWFSSTGCKCFEAHPPFLNLQLLPSHRRLLRRSFWKQHCGQRCHGGLLWSTRPNSSVLWWGMSGGFIRLGKRGEGLILHAICLWPLSLGKEFKNLEQFHKWFI